MRLKMEGDFEEKFEDEDEDFIRMIEDLED